MGVLEKCITDCVGIDAEADSVSFTCMSVAGTRAENEIVEVGSEERRVEKSSREARDSRALSRAERAEQTLPAFGHPSLTSALAPLTHSAPLFIQPVFPITSSFNNFELSGFSTQTAALSKRVQLLAHHLSQQKLIEESTEEQHHTHTIASPTHNTPLDVGMQMGPNGARPERTS